MFLSLPLSQVSPWCFLFSLRTVALASRLYASQPILIRRTGTGLWITMSNVLPVDNFVVCSLPEMHAEWFLHVAEEFHERTLVSTLVTTRCRGFLLGRLIGRTKRHKYWQEYADEGDCSQSHGDYSGKSFSKEPITLLVTVYWTIQSERDLSEKTRNILIM